MNSLALKDEQDSEGEGFGGRVNSYDLFPIGNMCQGQDLEHITLSGLEALSPYVHLPGMLSPS